MDATDPRILETSRVVVVASLLYATWVVASCPCKVVAECKQGEFYAATALPLVLVALLNGMASTAQA